jgi:hypothetical protein
MKVNFNVYFKDFDGSVLLIDKKPQCMGVIVSQCLFNGTGFRPVIFRRIMKRNYMLTVFA